MDIRQLGISDVLEVKNFKAIDDRGIFVKTFNSASFSKFGIEVNFKESYYSLSKKGVIRGMHFQLPPYDHNKLVYVTNGEVLDVVIDLRKSAKSYGQYASIILKAFNNSIYIPKGFAHGFLCLTETATVVYNVSTVYSPAQGSGIHWNSFGFDWLGITDPIVSARDASLVSLDNFQNPF